VLVRLWGLAVADNATSLTPAALPKNAGLEPSHVGVLGATSLVGECLLSLLTEAGWQVTAFSRKSVERIDNKVHWLKPLASPHPLPPSCEREIKNWICVAPIWVLPEHFSLLEAHGARRLVALSSTSRFTKDDSTDMEEQAMALRLAESEKRVQAWAQSHGVEWMILRPTLIYGLGRDKNISEIARFIRRFGFFPLFGKANGLRQPIHAADVASACVSALQSPCAANRIYNISGGETLSYRNMVIHVFTALERPPRLLSVPLSVFRVAVALLRCLPRYRQWSVAMAERMNKDLVFDHTDASQELGFKPRVFLLSAEDLPQ